MVQVPGATVVTVKSAAVHTAVVLEVNDTASPDDADADRATDLPTAAGDGWAKSIVCDFFPAAFTLNECCTGRAGAQVSLPSWVAVMVQVPGATVVTVESATVHTAVVLEVNETCSLEGVAFADKVTCAWTGVRRWVEGDGLPRLGHGE